MIPQSFIQELLSRVDIVEVVGRSVKLKKAGANYQGLCPFHNEKSPSFTVSPTKQFYHCFGCGASGDAIKFLTENFGMSFVDAVQDLAHGIGVDVPRVAGGPEAEAAEAARKQGLTLVQWLEKADHYYRQRLRETPAAIAYFKDRGVSGETARDFGLGYAPGGWRNLDGVLPDYAAKEAVDAGLVIAGEEGKRYDRFRERVMFPIRNPRGQVIGFGGRVLGAGEPKYLNSPEGPLFSKGRELYGLFEAREGIRAAGRVLVVEGYMDVVMLHQHGCKYAVATLGTATTAHHLQKLTRLADRIVFAFDGDSAGRRAAWRALENALPLLSDTRQLDFLFLPPEHDPDSFVRAEGLEAFEAEVARALPLSTFLLKELASRGDLTTPEGRARMQAELKPLVLQMPDIALRTQIMLDMAGRLGLA
ncbi:MAG: DNA primase, partial [Lautropia sp.]|nr:DNA primase [Lautropia sp.]